MCVCLHGCDPKKYFSVLLGLLGALPLDKLTDGGR